jgi:hypothetical protein
METLINMLEGSQTYYILENYLAIVSSTILLQLPHSQAIYCILLSIISKYGTVTILTLLYMKLSNSNKLRSIITYLHLLHANQNRLNNPTRIRLTLRKSTNQNIKTYTL